MTKNIEPQDIDRIARLWVAMYDDPVWGLKTSHEDLVHEALVKVLEADHALYTEWFHDAADALSAYAEEGHDTPELAQFFAGYCQSDPIPST